MSEVDSGAAGPTTQIRAGIELSDETARQLEDSSSSEHTNPHEGLPRQDESTCTQARLTQAQVANDVRVARLLFMGGFLALPWLWFVVWFHYRRIAKQPHASPALSRYVRYSGIGASVGCVLFLAWFTVVQLNWRSWGEWGRSIMMVFPEDDEL